ncbi:MAG: peptidylprolyl isomerase [Balneolaceae bacterium]|nr:peptidylprolyl isomerase [Balneolaceae bacterium]
MKKLLLLAVTVFLFVSCSSEEDPAQKDDIAIITTEFGDMHVLLYDQTPIHKENFLKLANEGFYDSTKFHRVIQGFMIQGGDPNSKDDNPADDGQGGPGYTLEAEFDNQLVHKKGAIAAARLGDQQNPQRRSSGSQFYIVHGRQVQSMELDQMLAQRNELARQDMIREYVQAPEQEELLNQLRTYMQSNLVDSVEATIAKIEPIATEGYVPTTYSPAQRDMYNELGGVPFLDGNYTVFGEVILGLNIVDSIAVQTTGQADRPLEDIPMTVRVETMDKAKIEQTYGYSYDQ